MQIQLNGELRDISLTSSLLDVMAEVGVKPELTAVQHNDVIVERDQIGEVQLADGDVVELIRIVGGG